MSRPRRARVVAALIAHPSDAGRFLVQQRLPHQSRANLWEFPGGKVEPAESDEAALARECREELDVELAVGRRLWSTVHRYTDLEVELLLHAARIVSGEAKAIRAQTIRYATPVEMQQLPFCEADLPLIDALARGELAK